MSTKRSITLIFTFNNRRHSRHTAAPIHPGGKGRKKDSINTQRANIIIKVILTSNINKHVFKSCLMICRALMLFSTVGSLGSDTSKSPTKLYATGSLALWKGYCTLTLYDYCKLHIVAFTTTVTSYSVYPPRIGWQSSDTNSPTIIKFVGQWI